MDGAGDGQDGGAGLRRARDDRRDARKADKAARRGNRRRARDAAESGLTLDLPDAPGEAPLARRAVVHLGLDKTGSSTIQHWLRRNAEALRRQGFHVDLLDDRPDPALDMVSAFAFIGQSADPGWLPKRRLAQRFHIRSRRQLSQRLQDLEARATASFPPREGGTWVVTSEQIGTDCEGEAEIRQLHRWLSARFARVDYVVYVRDQVAWVPSAYAQALKVGFCGSLDAFIAERGANDYHALARRWTDVVGEDRFALRLFDEVVRGGDLVEDFARTVGIDPAGMPSVPARNSSTSRMRLRGMRLQNILRRRLKRLGRSHWADRLEPLLDRLDRGAKLRLSPRQAAAVRALNRDSNEALRLWRFPDRPALFPDRGA